MSVTRRLLDVFRVENQIRGLTGRLRAAEAFLEEQDRRLAEIDAKRQAITSQLRQLAASAADDEGEVARLDERIATIREQMNSAKTNREYKAFLAELNTFAADRDRAEEAALEQMTRTDELKAQLAEFDRAHEERLRVRQVAKHDRDEKSEQIQGRLDELRTQRRAAAAEAPGDALRTLETLMENMGEEAMAPVEIQDRRRHEFTCGSCMMNIPVEAVNALLCHGGLTRCCSCSCILFVQDDVREALQPASSKH